jgi:hypothetical protein
MINKTQQELADAITKASRKAFSDLFSEYPGHYYYCALITTGEAHAPVISAWSQEALSAVVAGEKNPDDARLALKWSYADSPYYCYGSQHFEAVNTLIAERPRLTPGLSDEDWADEYQLRLEAMVAAMSTLDAEGVFGEGRKRLGTVILVEVAPPDNTNTERALRLNPPEALKEWLEEAAEE